jgi:hypothetical protein
MLKLRPVRRAHTCLSEGREPVSKALAQVLGTTKEFSYTREILARTSYLEQLSAFTVFVVSLPDVLQNLAWLVRNPAPVGQEAF